jgi:hypothetical protein
VKPFWCILPSVLLIFPLHAQESENSVHAPDPYQRERILSIFIPPKLNSPFSCTLRAEWTRTLEDGSTQTVENHRIVMRDRAGRIFQERRTLVPKDGQREPELMRTEISDPATHLKYFCYEERKVCDPEDYLASADPVNAPEGSFEQSTGSLTREDLGKNNIDGMDVTGTRETTTINAGVIGNDRPILITKEIWYSELLGLNIMVKRVDPRHGTQIFTVDDLNLADPDPKYFSLPAGFTVTGHGTPRK